MALALRCPAAASPSPARAPFPNSSTHSQPAPRLQRRSVGGGGGCRCHYYHGDGAGGGYDRVPKQFREENLKDGLMDNYKNVPQFLYGLSPSQMEMFMTDGNPYNRQSTKVTEESVAASRSYDEFGMYSLSGTHEGPANYSMGMGMPSMSMGRAGRGYRRMRSSAPDLPSLLLDSRIIFLGMPIVPAVTELIAAQFLWLDYDDRTKPIYLYINSTGTMDENNELVASETDAYAIADFINRSKAKVYTINLSMAYGQAAMLLSLGEKGKRGVLPNSITKLHLPKVHKSGGAAIDMWIKAKELETNTDYYLELVSKGVGKPKEELAEFLRGPRYFRAQEAIDYGIADTILHSLDGSFKPKDLTAQLAKAQKMQQSGKRAPAGAGRWSTPTAPR
ncbi:ATP-dependent Clp protease proteolytic subunit-related protein 1, chloroplastic-like [Lolium rigidum]|uniref:ATP-dependent Clp protease proteolytic subunit-related protein 1, chloroplastic-like n=1 Tax=Lolium rigidum TaxID=89674 RepID=UPI001F5D3265|nr:ATP-dependent Clp protease proteolytic subunit-related protein 1, chloroplastic-like [Lolium rigidum]